MTIGVSEVARAFRVDRNLVKTWAFHFREYLSREANPEKGVPRTFSPADTQVLAYVAMHWEAEPDLESIRIGLDRGDHDDEIFRDVRTQFTPLFQSPPEDLDETWDWGVLLGGMAGSVSDEFDLAEAFRFAGDTLVDTLVRDPERYRLVYPVLFSYRHAMELYLKAALSPKTLKHELQPLLERLRTHLKEEHNAAIPRWFEGLVLEFDDFDPRSTMFRYADSSIVSRRTGDRGEFWVDLVHAKRIMGWVSEGFRRILAAQGRPRFRI